MDICIPQGVKNREHRAGLTPLGVKALVQKTNLIHIFEKVLAQLFIEAGGPPGGSRTTGLLASHRPVSSSWRPAC